MRLLDQPHDRVRGLLASGAPVFLPVNPVEFHGPHLSLHNDRLLSHGVARDLHARLFADHPFLLADDLELGVDPCPGPGTRATRYGVLRRAVLAACQGLHALGAQAVILVTFHGSPLHAWALQAGVAWLQARGVVAAAPFSAITDLLLDGDVAGLADGVAPIADPAARAETLAELPFDFHAGYFETSLALHWAPESVSAVHRTLPPCPPVRPDRWAALASRLAWGGLAAELRFAARGLGWYALRPFPGYTNRPHLATAEAGAWFAEQVVARQAEVVEAALDRRPTPKPMMGWLRWATLGGRLAQPTVPVEAVALTPPAGG